MAQYLTIVFNLPILQSFTYLDIKTESAVRTGCRAEVKFGNRKMTGYVTAEHEQLPADCPVQADKIRPILRMLDTEPLFNSELTVMAKWISSYYLCSFGEALAAMIPGGRKESGIASIPFDDSPPVPQPLVLSEEQHRAAQEIVLPGKTNLHYLYGPTGTGKTEVFLQVAQTKLTEGKGVIYLVPEIGLTQQVIEAVISRFGQTAAVLHSGLTPSQRLAEWRRILNRQARVVIGARSAVFAPVPDLGIIIIDEEHDGSYKSGSTPRYHARQVAMYRTAQLNIPLVLGSATPSVESWHLMNEKKIIRHTLTKRLAGGSMPLISTVNLSTAGNSESCISKDLANAINETIAKKRQTILFLNRRGFTHFFRCNSCGFELKCKNCSIALTFHKSEKKLRCHYCGWSTDPPQQCPACGSLDVGYSGFGTEYIEAELAAKFPNARVIRVDTDSLTHKGALQEKLSAFRNGEYDIMLGTQMVAKGLNFPNLMLVGIILADTGLHIPDFRASERTFSLITQVAGRAGRFFPDGRVIVQSYNPDREPIACAVTGEIEKFYSDELATRKILNFPPFSRIIRLVFRAPTAREAYFASAGAVTLLEKILSDKKQNNCEILGPAECPIVKIASNFRYQVLLRGQQIRPILQLAAELLYGYTQPANVYIECDVDPVSML